MLNIMTGPHSPPRHLSSSQAAPNIIQVHPPRLNISHELHSTIFIKFPKYYRVGGGGVAANKWKHIYLDDI